MHCSVCQTDFNTLSAYVKHHRDSHSHSKNVRLVCSCGGTFSTLRSLQTHWRRFHKNKEEIINEDTEVNEKSENDDKDLSSRRNQEESSDLGFRMESSDTDAESVNNESMNISDETGSLREEEHLKIFEKRIAYVPFLLSPEQYLRLPKVQADLHRTITDYDPDCIQDFCDGDFARNHQNFQKSTYLKIELNSDDLTITNSISHRAHSIFFFY
ncbi:unnamed protein product [Rotaria sp. Silwood2]|nr:unnamed protein product [Rotaria sp. Silwood2]CAF4108932.1 unnamed protein product [Rotaria sp. Silwood2]